MRQRLRGEDRARTTRLIDRIFGIADDLARTRERLQSSGHLAGAVRAGDAELRALTTLLDRLGVDHLDTLALLDDGDQLAKAVGQLARSNPDAGRQLADYLDQLGATTLAEPLRAITTTTKEIQP